MAKKNFSAALKHTVAQQDETLQQRFAAAESVLMSESVPELQARVQGKPVPRIKKPVHIQSDLVVRDTFSMPEVEYGLIDKYRSKAAKAGHIYTKSEIIRASLLALGSMNDKVFLEQLGKVSRLKPGRKG